MIVLNSFFFLGNNRLSQILSCIDGDIFSVGRFITQEILPKTLNVITKSGITDSSNG